MKKITTMFLVLVATMSIGMGNALAEDTVSASQLRAIEKKQDRILRELEELKAELQIVKIRVTSR